MSDVNKFVSTFITLNEVLIELTGEPLQNITMTEGSYKVLKKLVSQLGPVQNIDGKTLPHKASINGVEIIQIAAAVKKKDEKLPYNELLTKHFQQFRVIKKRLATAKPLTDHEVIQGVRVPYQEYFNLMQLLFEPDSYDEEGPTL
ncbi:MAG: hypothetical protein GY938_10410 [Ketobacter sp.]|nr:hypothetical protein [Ketobacter sp.]